MNVTELVTELRENILGDRSDRVAGSPDYLWSEETLVRYINEAERRLARRALILRDSKPSTITTVTLVAGQDQYPLHLSVLGVVSARLEGARTDLARVGHSLLDDYRTPESPLWDASSIATTPTGAPVAFTTDETLGATSDDTLSRVTLRVYPIPAAAQAGETIQLRVVRLPKNPLTMDDLQAVPEVPEDYHLPMLSWAAYLALRIRDRDAGSMSSAKEFEAMFERTVLEARQELMRKVIPSLGWQFGGNGFTYSR